MSFVGKFHEPVLLKEMAGLLTANKDTTKAKLYADCTLGGGGYTREILKSTPEGVKAAALDKDVFAIEHCKKVLAEFGERVIFVQANFSNIKKAIQQAGFENVSGVVMDLGLSTYQLNYEAGFSYQRNTELDMRADKSQKLTAKDVLNKYDEKVIAKILFEYGELRYSRKIAREIAEYRKKKKFETTFDLVELLKKQVPPRYLNRDLSKLFQAIRIEVNNELENLKNALEDSVDVLEHRARIVAVSYHSLEDRIVKNFFRNNENLKVITKKPVEPGEDEISRNIRARSAKLRAAERI
ncbi:MAG: 16S rRNA (cytosine(1402)-N(4))-methyltransferase RsmH [Chlorobi bacterium]|nr:16S rRNA (cytosine(1402)-N(4))-methyltransferase RsmH [Chlorobiota bacterium]